MKNKILIPILIGLLLPGLGKAQTNLLDTSTWTVGNGSVSGFNRVGSDAENVRENGQDPFGNTAVLWKAAPDTGNNNDGGWNTPYLAIDHTKTYRLTVWVKKTNSNGGVTRFGFNSRNAANAQVNLRTNGTSLSNPYFLNGDLPTLDKWYLLVGMVHASDYTGTEVLSGIYDPDTGLKVMDASTDYKFDPTAVTLRHRTFLARTTNTADFQFMFDPALYEVNGAEPSIADLLPAPPSGNSPWAVNGPDINYASGNVAIGRATVPPGYRLAVEGNIRSREIRVDQDTWPDYVFEAGYELPSLESIRKHIETHGHLPNIPSAAEVQQNGVELGEMNKLLLEKIEQLTLYLLQQEQRIQELENQKQ